MKKILFVVFISILVQSCFATKKATVAKNNPIITKKTSPKPTTILDIENRNLDNFPIIIRNILEDAEKYLGTPYKFSGTSSSGFDCSGFTMTVFQENNIALPRRSSDQANFGDPVSTDNIKEGDLLFFATSGGSRVTHVGIVHDVSKDGNINFIHASTSKGVMISSLKDKYWGEAFLFARRVL